MKKALVVLVILTFIVWYNKAHIQGALADFKESFSACPEPPLDVDD